MKPTHFYFLKRFLINRQKFFIIQILAEIRHLLSWAMWWVILILHPGQCPSANEDCSLTSSDSTTYFLESFGVTVGIILRHKKQTGLGNIELFCSDGRRDERYTYEGIHRRNYQRINIYLSIAVKIPTFFITCGIRKIFCQNLFPPVKK